MRKPLRIVYPKRGNPPPLKEGYCHEKGETHIHVKIWLPCFYHGISAKNEDICSLFNKPINQNTCENCNVRCELPESTE